MYYSKETICGVLILYIYIPVETPAHPVCCLIIFNVFKRNFENTFKFPFVLMKQFQKL